MKPRLYSPAFALICVAQCLGTSGCILGSSKAEDVIAKALPTPNRQLACNDEGVDGPPGRSCALIVQGSENDVVNRLVNGLTEQGFATECDQTSTGVPGIEVVGVRHDMQVIADVMPQGFAEVLDGSAVFFPPGASTSSSGKILKLPSATASTSSSPKTVTIPPGSVGLTIDASEYRNAAAIGTSCDDPAWLAP
jgi:hypothetical protein